MPLRTLADLIDFVHLVLAPDFDVAAAQRRLGPIDHWTGETAFARDVDPALVESAIETIGGVVFGVRTALRAPLVVPWSDLRRALGEPEMRVVQIDNFSGLVTYLFNYGRPGARGLVMLYAHHGQDPARIEQIIVRPDKPLPGVAPPRGH